MEQSHLPPQWGAIKKIFFTEPSYLSKTNNEIVGTKFKIGAKIILIFVYGTFKETVSGTILCILVRKLLTIKSCWTKRQTDNFVSTKFLKIAKRKQERRQESLVSRYCYRSQHLAKLLCVKKRQCCGFVTFWHGSRSADPYLSLTDTDPAPGIFLSDLQDADKKEVFFAYYFLKVHLHIFQW